MRHRTTHISSGIVLLTLAPGCGLVWLPYQQRFPDPIRAVRVVDSVGESTISDVVVELQLTKVQNWAHFAPSVGLLRSPCSTEVNASGSDVVKFRRDGSSFLPVRRTQRVGWLGWFFPIPSPLGWTLYDDYLGTIHVKARNYSPIVLQYSPALPPKAGLEAWAHVSDKMRHPSFSSDGVLTLYLSRADPSHEIPRVDHK